MAEIKIDISDIVDRAIDKLIEAGWRPLEWIPCSERMPEQNREVIVCCYGSDLIVTQEGETIEDAVKRISEEYVTVTVGFIGSDGWYGADWFPMMVTPSYWMPFPEPPEGGAKDGN